ncbi:MAG: ABC transporter permease [Vicinamibacteria bacterium]
MRGYRLLLHLYPASFRAEYGVELLRLLAVRRRETGPGLPLVGFWLAELRDLLASAAGVHADLLRQDLRYAARKLRAAPGFAATAVLVTALGIGANTAVFSVLDRVLIRPLPFPESDRLVKLWERVPQYARMEASPANFRDWQRLARSFEAMGAYQADAALNLVGEGEPRRLQAAAVSADLLPLLGALPQLGHLFAPRDDAEGAPATVLLSHGLWQSQFGGDPDVIGRRVRLDQEVHEVIGVLPAGFSFPDRETLLWTPLRLGPASFEDRDNNYLKVVARLKRGIAADDARSELSLIAAQLEAAYPAENARTGITLRLLRDEVSEQSRLLLSALFAAALCVLLLACTNLAGLLLARALRRRRELSVRAALGAGQERLVRQLLTESLLLSGLGGALGMLLAAGATPLLARLVPSSLPLDGASLLDTRVLAFALALSLATGLGFGVVPALHSCAGAGVGGLREGARSQIGGGRERLRFALVVAQVAAAVALVASSGLLARALARVRAVDPGFRAEGVLAVGTPLPPAKYASVPLRVGLYARVLSEVRALPGVSHAAYVSFLPMAMGGGIWPVGLEGRPDDPSEQRRASLRFVSTGFFGALGIPLKRGRDVSEGDTAETPFVAVVSESFAREHWPGQDPLGRAFKFAFSERTVVGVVGDIRVRGLERPSEPQVYLPYGQVPDGGLVFYTPKELVIRASQDPASLAPAVRGILRRADPELPIASVRPLSGVLDDETAPRRTQLLVLSTFAALALLLAGLGIHGLLSYTVSQRIPEIGLRLALGATPRGILGLVVGDGLAASLRGAVIGLGLAYLAGRSMQALLFGVPPGDLAASLAGVALAVLMTLSGSLLPALRALRVDPTVALRADS